MFCYKCGKQISADVKYCQYCGASQTIKTESSAGNSTPQPSIQSSEYHFSYVNKQPDATQQETQLQQPKISPQPSQTAMLASQHCSYKVAMESDFKKFEFGGMPEGTVDIYSDRLEFFKKSKMVALAFGAIGSALNGKGKEDITVYRNMVRNDSISAEKNIFRFILTNGRTVYIQLIGLSSQNARNAMRTFLNI